MNALVSYNSDEDSDPAAPRTDRVSSRDSEKAEDAPPSPRPASATCAPPLPPVSDSPSRQTQSTSKAEDPSAGPSTAPGNDNLYRTSPASASRPREDLSPSTLSDPSSELTDPTLSALLPPACPGPSSSPFWGLSTSHPTDWSPHLEAKLRQFHTLKTQGTHFNTSLTQNRAFKNPHIYDKLVSFVDIDETGSNWPSMVAGGQSGFALSEEEIRDYSADAIAQLQKRQAEERQAAQATGKRSAIDFTPSASSPGGASRGSDRATDRKGGDKAADALRKAAAVRDSLNQNLKREAADSDRHRDGRRDRDFDRHGPSRRERDWARYHRR